jgi:hypothetical protein
MTTINWRENLPPAAFSDLPETNDPEALFFLHGFAPTPEGLPPPLPDPEAMRIAWLPWVKDWYGDEKYYELEGCHRHGGTYECPAGGERHRFPRACNLTTCPVHGSRKLKRAWMKRLKHMAGPLVLAEWHPPVPTDDFAGIRKQAEKWRRGKIEGGAHWVRYARDESGNLTTLMLFVLQEVENLPLELTIVRAGVTNDDALAWLQRHYTDECALAQSRDEMVTIMEAQHRLQPFGPDRKRWEEKSEHEHSESTPRAEVEFLHLDDSTNYLGVETQPRPAPTKQVLCPIHGVPMKYLGLIGPLSEYTYDPKYDTWVQYAKGGP